MLKARQVYQISNSDTGGFNPTNVRFSYNSLGRDDGSGGVESYHNWYSGGSGTLSDMESAGIGWSKNLLVDPGFIDADNDGNCDNIGSRIGSKQGRR